MVGYKLLPLSAGIVFIGMYFHNSFFWQPPLPVIEDIIWKSSENPNDNSISPFTINVPQQDLEYLKQRLQNTSIVPPLKGVNSQYGINTDQLRSIIDHWGNNYDWRKREKLLNSVPHFRTQISGLNIHFIRIKPPPKLVGDKQVLPLLLLHGWPGSVREFYNIFPLLTTPRKEYNFVFEVVAPSLPGYGFSDAATLPGLNAAQIALIMKKLMNRLGFEKFYVQGGDWGFIIGSSIATIYPESVHGFHSNMCAAMIPTPLSIIKLIIGSFFPSLIVDSKFAHKLYPLSNFFHFTLAESGYFHLQATKPDTLGVGLTDSPAGLAAYILEKFSLSVNVWSQPSDNRLKVDPLFGEKFTTDDLLDNVMIYWASNSITSSMRLYAELFTEEFRVLKLQIIPTFVPTVCAHYPKEVIYSPESIMKDKFKNLIHSSHMPRGGHFAAFEEPVLFANDFWKGICIIQNHISNTQYSC